MSFKELYQSKKMDADQALNLIRSGDRVVVGHACAEPSYLLDVLTEKAEYGGDGKSRILRPRHGKAFPAQFAVRGRFDQKSRCRRKR